MIGYRAPTPEQIAAYERQQRAAGRLQAAIMLAGVLAMRGEAESVQTIARRAPQLAAELIQQNEGLEALASAYTPPKVAT